MQNNPAASGLQYDDLGFIIGMKRMGRDVDKISGDVEAIRKILEQALAAVKGSAGQSERTQPLSAYQRALLDATQRTAVDFEEHLQRTITPVNQSLVDATDALTDLIDQAASQQASNNTSQSTRSAANNSSNRPGRSRITPNSDTVDVGSTESLRRNFGRQNADNASGNDTTTDRSRDSRGRFTGDGSDNGQKSFFSKVAKGFVGAIKGVMPDSKGVDPTVDAINELGILLSPVRKVAGFALRPLSGLFKSRKRNEPIPREQEQHNRRQIKLLQRIADNLKGSRAGKLLGGAGGLLGGLFGGVGKLLKGGGKGLLKLLKLGKGIPLLGGLAAGASLFDWKDQSTEERGGTVGSLAGGAAGAALGSLLGPVGTIAGGMLGAWAGEKLGTVVAPYVKNWTDNLIRADIPGRIVSAWKTFTDGLGAYFKEAWNNIVEKGKEITSDVKDTGNSIADFGASLVDKGLAFFGNKDAQERVDQRERGEIGFQRENYVAKTTNNAPTPLQTLQDTANSLVTQPVSDNQKDRIKQAYDAAIAAGFSHKQAVALVGEVGRENDFKLNNLFGSHADPARGHNLGMFSWQGNRRKALEKFLSDKGLLNKDGTIQRSQAALQAQFEFAKQEMSSNSKWKAGFLDKKDINIDDARSQLGGKGSYVGWARGQNNIRKADGSRVPFDWKAQEAKANRYSAETEKLAKSVVKPISTKTPDTPAALAKFAQNAEVPKAQPIITKDSPIYVWRKPVEVKATRSTTNSNLTTQQVNPAPKIESVKERLSSPAPKEVVVLNQNNDTISQNVSNRGLAHAFTGGLGMGKN